MRLYQIKRLLHSKETITRTKTTYRMGENLAIYSLDKGLISRIYKELKKLNTKKQTIPLTDK
jgi:hypothetical protein